MDTLIYTNRGQEVPLGVECALPYLAHSTPSLTRGGAKRRYPIPKIVQRLLKGDRHAATSEEPDPVHP
jgi:hypothetical protein